MCKLTSSLKICFVILVSIMSIMLVGCHLTIKDVNIFRDRSEDYKAARVYPPLEIPKDVEADTCTDSYQIP